jgi:hypothetical protein
MRSGDGCKKEPRINADQKLCGFASFASLHDLLFLELNGSRVTQRCKEAAKDIQKTVEASCSSSLRLIRVYPRLFFLLFQILLPIRM